jgi:hypothetical protein
MNIERLKEIAEWLEAGAPHKCGLTGFYMPAVFKIGSCGTKACLAGAAIELFAPDELRQKLKVDHNSRHADAPTQGDCARDLLGLTDSVSDQLFFPDNHEDSQGNEVNDLSSVTPAWAARVVRNLIATGEVDWYGMKEEKLHV